MYSFLQELNGDNIGGVASRNVQHKKSIISYFTGFGDATVAELCKALTVSAPKVAALLNDLIDEGVVQDYGKVDTTEGRKPNSYGLVANSGFFLGVDVRQSYVNIGLSDFKKNMVKTAMRHPYDFRNTPESLTELCSIINNFIKHAHVAKSKMLGVCINLSGRVNHTTGYSYSFFNFREEPLSEIIEKKLGLKVYLENDSKAMAYGEFNAGIANKEKNVLFLNLDMGVGMGVVIEGQLYYGKSGYAGEIGHIPLFDNEIICHCGKKGCLETEASGWALVQMIKDKIKKGSTSLLTQHGKKATDITLDDIIQAANNDDVLAIELIETVGAKLGRGIAMLINIFNPELIILGGRLATTRDYISLPIKSAINKYSLSLINIDTQVRTSELGEKAGITGACLLVRQRLLDN